MKKAKPESPQIDIVCPKIQTGEYVLVSKLEAWCEINKRSYSLNQPRWMELLYLIDSEELLEFAKASAVTLPMI